MFADIVAAYYRRIISLYLNEDGDSSGSECCDGSGTDEYLFNNHTISGDIGSNTSSGSSGSGDEEMPRPLAPPLFSYC